MTNTGQSDALAPLYRPESPNVNWLAGASSRSLGVPRSACDLLYPGSRWEWQAGWDWRDREIEAGR